ncbi:unnamed protein product, partial [Rangifer tarandus platyrhynchus]
KEKGKQEGDKRGSEWRRRGRKKDSEKTKRRAVSGRERDVISKGREVQDEVQDVGENSSVWEKEEEEMGERREIGNGNKRKQHMHDLEEKPTRESGSSVELEQWGRSQK